MNDLLLYFSIKYKGNWEEIFKALEEKERIPINKIFEFHKKEIDNFLTIMDKDYPITLKEVYKPPFLLFFSGNVSLLKTKTISLFGDWSIRDILKIWNNDKNITFVITWEKKNYSLIKKLNENNINFICVSENGINIKNNLESTSENYLIISEFIKNNPNIDKDQLLARISIGISKKVLIKYKESDIDVITGLEIGKIEGAKIYYIGYCEKSIVEKFNLIKISKLSNIFLNKN